MIRAQILGTASRKPGRQVSTEEVCERAYPGRDPEQLIRKTGIRTRWFADPETTVAGLATETIEAALENAGLPKSELRRVILCNTHGGDVVSPATANGVVDMLGVNGTCDSFDLVNGCTTFVTGFDLACRCVATGMGPIAVCAVELISRHCVPEIPRPYAIFGDASAAAIVGPTDKDAGLLAARFGNDGRFRRSVYMDYEAPFLARFGASNAQITLEAVSGLRTSAEHALAEAEMSIDDARYVVMHQGNGVMTRRAARQIGVDPAKMINVVEDMGSIGCASVPTQLDRLLRSVTLDPGDRLLICSVGAGLSYGALVYQA